MSSRNTAARFWRYFTIASEPTVAQSVTTSESGAGGEQKARVSVLQAQPENALTGASMLAMTAEDWRDQFGVNVGDHIKQIESPLKPATKTISSR